MNAHSSRQPLQMPARFGATAQKTADSRGRGDDEILFLAFAALLFTNGIESPIEAKHFVIDVLILLWILAILAV